MGSYVAFYLLGMYPLPATRQMLISSPYFPKVSIYNPFYKSVTTFIAHGFQGNPEDGHGNVYVSVSQNLHHGLRGCFNDFLMYLFQNVTIDGQPWHSNCFVEWDVFENGSTVELFLTDDRTVACGDDDNALPPSLSTGGYD